MEAVSSADHPLVLWHDATVEPAERVDAVTDGTSAVQVGSSLSTFSGDEIVRMASRLSVDTILDLALTPVEDQPALEYRSKERSYMNFKDASAGQQATALLGVLLNQGGPPLIVDQPEDDLHSQVIQEIVQKM